MRGCSLPLVPVFRTWDLLGRHPDDSTVAPDDDRIAGALVLPERLAPGLSRR
jgi:hypothetical protein